MVDFESRLVGWYEENKRVLPWRETRDPYAIWLSEIILQQTRVNQGLPYYQKFIIRYPEVEKLAAAPKDEVFKLWQGLGYYRRAENMLKAARVIVEKYEGRFPDDFTALKKLPGVGEYTAAAIASMAFGQKVAVVDGNVYRVLSRIFGIRTVIQTSPAKKEFGAIMLSLMKRVPPGTFNEAVMEFGALQCVPVNPACSSCIFSEDCFAFRNNEINNLPVIKPKKKKRNLFLYYLVIKFNGNIVLRRREKEDIWKGLYDFPSLEYTTRQKKQYVFNEIGQLSILSEEAPEKIEFLSQVFKHQLTHIEITARFIEITVNHQPDLETDKSLYLIPVNNLSKYPVSRLVERYLETKG